MLLRLKWRHRPLQLTARNAPTMQPFWRILSDATKGTPVTEERAHWAVISTRLLLHSSLTVFARRRKHRVDHKWWEDKQPRIATMKRMLTSAACAIFIIGTACAREVTASLSLILHRASIIAARRIAQLDRPAREGVLPCNADVHYDDPRRREQHYS